MGPERAHGKHLQIRQKLLILVAVPLALIVLLVLVFALLYGLTERAVAAVRQPRLAVQASDSLRTALLDAETGMRGYVLTGKREFVGRTIERRHRSSVASANYGRLKTVMRCRDGQSPR